MSTKKDFQIDRRVGIALDALSPSQKAALKPVLQSREGFVAHAKRPGVSKKVSPSKPLYVMRVGGGMRIIYTVKEDEAIVVQDLMRKPTIDHFVSRKRSKAQSLRTEHGKSSSKKAEAVKRQKV
jgi:mRNA-degrading endonuclease RelE of RelBE toxin-antitoxin system